MTVQSVLKVLVIAGIAVEPILEGVGLFGRWEGGISKLVAGWKLSEPSRVAIVRIDRYDYDLQFDSTTPLPAEPLGRVIAAVAHSGATRIGIDLDTSHSSYRSLAPLAADSRLVWGQPADYSQVNHAFFLRGKPIAGSDPSAVSGLTVVAADRDGVVRRYRPSYQKVPEAEPGGAAAKQFLQSLVAKVAGSPDSGSQDDVLIDFRNRERQEWSASDLLGEKQAEIQEKLRGRIVLIGSVVDARDEHQTPLGWRNGVEILADAVDTELKILDGGRYRAPSQWVTISWMVLIAAATWLLFRFRGNTWSYAAFSGGLLALILLAAWTAYGSLIDCLYFLPTVAAISSGPAWELVKNRSDRMKKRWKKRKRRLPSVRDHAPKSDGVNAPGVDRAAD